MDRVSQVIPRQAARGHNRFPPFHFSPILSLTHVFIFSIPTLVPAFPKLALFLGDMRFHDLGFSHRWSPHLPQSHRSARSATIPARDGPRTSGATPTGLRGRASWNRGTGTRDHHTLPPWPPAPMVIPKIARPMERDCSRRRRNTGIQDGNDSTGTEMKHLRGTKNPTYEGPSSPSLSLEPSSRTSPLPRRPPPSPSALRKHCAGDKQPADMVRALTFFSIFTLSSRCEAEQKQRLGPQTAL